jgi:hypothetical protein
MRRILVALFGVVFGTTLLVGLKYQGVSAAGDVIAGAPQDPGATAGPGQQPGVGPGTTAKLGEPGTTPGPGAHGSPGTTPKPGQSSSSGQSTTPHPGGGGSSPTSPAPPPPPPPGGQFVGASIAVKTAQSPSPKSGSCGDCHNYSMSVTISVSNGQITSVSAAYNTGPGASLTYYNRAVNNLSPKVLSSQAWNLGKVSSATYSGNAFELSLKDAMSKAGLPT